MSKPRPDHNDPTIDLLSRLWAIDHALQVVSKRMHAEIGVTGRQRVAIRLIGRTPGISPGKLAEALHVDPSTLTGVLSRLVRSGLVRREAVDSDGRRAALYLTPAGSAIEGRRSGTVEASIRGATANLPADAVKTCDDVLAAICAALENG